jgi:hypothetical protein
MTKNYSNKKNKILPPPPLNSNNKIVPPQKENNGSFIGSMINGFALGAGSSIGHNVVGRIFGNSTNNTITKTEPNTITRQNLGDDLLTKEYLECTKLTSPDHCKHLLLTKEYLECTKISIPSNCSYIFDGYKNT